VAGLKRLDDDWDFEECCDLDPKLEAVGAGTSLLSSVLVVVLPGAFLDRVDDATRVAIEVGHVRGDLATRGRQLHPINTQARPMDVGHLQICDVRLDLLSVFGGEPIEARVEYFRQLRARTWEQSRS
jgi:hypothetical protein